MAGVWRGILAYRRRMLLIGTTAALVLAATLPVTELVSREAFGRTHLRPIPTLASNLLEWAAPVAEPPVVHQEAIHRLYRLLLGTGFTTLVMGGLTLLAFANGLARVRSRALRIARAVGASRRMLQRSAIVETVLIGGTGILLGGISGLLVASAALAGWPGASGPLSASLGVLVGFLVFGNVALGFLFPIWYGGWHRGRVLQAPSSGRGLVVPIIQLGLAMSVMTAGVALRRAQANLSHRSSAGQGTSGRLYTIGREDAPPLSMPERATQYTYLIDSLRAHRTLVGISSPGTTIGLGTVTPLTTECGACSLGSPPLPWHIVPTSHFFVSADSFQALGIELHDGRLLQDSDRWGTEPVVVVNRALALDHFERGDAVGRRLKLGTDRMTWHQVVGIVEDGSPTGLGPSLQPAYAVYASVLQHPPGGIEILLQPDRGISPDDVSRMLNRPVGTIISRSMEEVASTEADRIAWFGRWFLMEGVALFLLAVGGTFITMTLWVRSLRGEIGIRRAMGASRAAIYRYISVRALGVGLAGTAMSLWFGPGLWAALPALVPNVPAWDWSVLWKLSLLLAGVTMVGAAIPTYALLRHPPATQTDP